MTPSEAESSPSSPLRRLYDLVLAEAETKRGPAVLAVVSFTESSFFPIPPDPLLIALGIGSPRRAIPLALLTTVMSVLGGILGYFIGAWMMESIGNSSWRWDWQPIRCWFFWMSPLRGWDGKIPLVWCLCWNH